MMFFTVPRILGGAFSPRSHEFASGIGLGGPHPGAARIPVPGLQCGRLFLGEVARARKPASELLDRGGGEKGLDQPPRVGPAPGEADLGARQERAVGRRGAPRASGSSGRARRRRCPRRRGPPGRASAPGGARSNSVTLDVGGDPALLLGEGAEPPGELVEQDQGQCRMGSPARVIGSRAGRTRARGIGRSGGSGRRAPAGSSSRTPRTSRYPAPRPAGDVVLAHAVCRDRTSGAAISSRRRVASASGRSP